MTNVPEPQWSRFGVLISSLLLAGCGLLNPTLGPDLAHLRALVWNQTAGQIVWVSGGSSPTTQTAIGQTGHNVALCSESPDGRSALVAYGESRERLAVLNSDSARQPIELGETDQRSCLSGHSMFSADSTRLIYLTYAPQPTSSAVGSTSGLAVGTLNLISLPADQPQVLADQTAAFDWHATVLFALTGSGAGLTPQQWITGKSGDPLAAPKPIGTAILPTAGCAWVDAQLRATGTITGSFDRLLVALGESCGQPAAETVHLFSIPLTGGAVTEIYHQAVNGTYDSNRVLSALVIPADGKNAYLAVPNGQTPDLSDIVQIDLAKPPQFAPNAVGNLYMARSALNATGMQWGVIILNPGGGETLEILDLTHPDHSAVTLTDSNRSSFIPAMTWGQAGKRLIYAYIGNESALGYLDLNGALASVLPGKFQYAVTDSTGKIALTVKADNGDLLAVAVPGGSTKTLIGGKADVTVMPLALLNTP